MKKMFVLLVLGLAPISLACSGSSGPDSRSAPEAKDKKKDKEKDETEKGTAPNANSPAPGQCDKALWQRVYESDRLEIKDDCKTVTGVIAERNADEDGDEHMLLKLDPGQDDLLTKKNVKKKDGDLVIEAVCVNAPDRKKVGNTCEGYTNAVHLPQVGDHVTVTGSYVIDSNNGWAEIHPITSINTR